AARRRRRQHRGGPMIRTMKMAATGLVTLALGAGCVAKEDDAARFREPIPHAEDVGLKVPGASAASGTTTQTLRRPGAPATPAPAGEYYRLTRDLTGAVDLVTAITLGAIWALVQTPPTSIDAKHAVWGPGQGTALDPVVWRFRVTEVADGEYDYVL